MPDWCANRLMFSGLSKDSDGLRKWISGGGGHGDVAADYQAHQAIVEQQTNNSGIRNDVKGRVDNMASTSREDIGNTQGRIQGEENNINQQYTDLQNHHKTEQLSQNHVYNREKDAQRLMPGADSPEELMKRAKDYQDKHKQ